MYLLSDLMSPVLVLEEERSNYSAYIFSAILVCTSFYILSSLFFQKWKVITLVVSETMPFSDYFYLFIQLFVVLLCPFSSGGRM